MKAILFIQRKKGRLRKSPIKGVVAEIDGEQSRLYALEPGTGTLLDLPLNVQNFSIGADGIMFKGFQEDNPQIYYQEWFLKIGG